MNIDQTRQRFRINRVSQSFEEQEPQFRYMWHMIRWTDAQKQKLRTFIDGFLWFSRLTEFKDVREGRLPKKNLGLLDMLLTPEQSKYTKREYRLAARRGYASCWHMSDEEPSEEVWNLKFGHKHKAVALRTTPQLLRSHLAPFMDGPGPCYLSSIQYIDHDQDERGIPEGNTIDVAFRVRKEHERQREARLFFNCYGAAGAKLLQAGRLVWDKPPVRIFPAAASIPGKTEFRSIARGRLGLAHVLESERAIVVRINPAQLIEAVLVGRRMNKNDYTELMKMLEGSPLEDKVVREGD